MTDDQGYWARQDITAELHMPQLHRLADRSRDFTRAFCASPVCSPARASVLTGRMPSAHGVHDWLRTGMNQDAPFEFLDGLQTIPAHLADAGYRCGHVGKWHLGDARFAAPGFRDWQMVHRAGGGPYFRPPVWIDGEPANPEGYLTTMINDAATDVLSDMLAGDDPFYLQVHHTAPHTPWAADQHPREYLKLYDDCDFPSLPREPVHPWFNRTDGELGRATTDPLWPSSRKNSAPRIITGSTARACAEDGQRGHSVRSGRWPRLREPIASHRLVTAARAWARAPPPSADSAPDSLRRRWHAGHMRTARRCASRCGSSGCRPRRRPRRARHRPR
jgi:arylsulfatase A-like enzyme